MPSPPEIDSIALGNEGSPDDSLNSVSLSGTADPESLVSLFNGTSVVGSVEANAAGAWSLATPDLPDGSYPLTATAIDADGDISSSSAAITVSLDPQQTNAPLIEALSSGNDGGADTWALAGAGAANSNVDLFDNGVFLGSASANANGAWSFTTSGPASDLNSFTAEDNGAVSAPLIVAVGATSQSLSANDSPIVIADGATAEIAGISGQAVDFTDSTGTLKIDDAVAFTGQVSGLTGSDVLDLADISYGASTTATFLGNASGGTLTVSDGTQAVALALVGDYLSSSWNVSSDGNGGTDVVDPVSPNDWQALGVGAGGYLTGIDVAPDGTMVVRTDTYGAYIWNGTEWQQLVTSTSMPAQFLTADNLQNASQGVYEIQIAPSNSSILYMMFEGYIFVSTNKGTTWTETSFAPVTASPGDNYRTDGQKMAVDPNNPNIVYAGTPSNGLFVTKNGGATWQSVSGVPISLMDGSGDYPGITGIEFDPALGETGGNTNTIFAASYGNGVYESINAGTSWALLSGGPTEVISAAVSSTGVYYATNDNGDTSSLWSFAGGQWTELLSDYSGDVKTVAVDPSNPSEIVVQSGGGNIDVSYNAGETWSGFNDTTELSAADVPWLADTSTFMSTGGAVFNPLEPNELISSAGVGVWTTDISTDDFNIVPPVVWTSQSIGIEQLVANEIIVPPGGDPVLASWDRPFFYINDQTESASSYSPYSGATLAQGWSLDYASSDPSFVVGIADWYGIEDSGYSTDGGQTWSVFPSFPADNGAVGGTIAASSPTDIIWAPSGGIAPYYTLNGGETWNTITLPSVSNWSGFDWAYYLDARTVTADRVLANTFYLYYSGERSIRIHQRRCFVDTGV